MAQATTKSGSVQGTNTIDIHEFRGFKDDDVINFQVNATGRGKNILTIKIQQKRDVSGMRGWKTLATRKLDPPASRFAAISGSVSVRDFFVNSDGNEQIRVRLSRKLGTKRIDYLLIVN